MLENKIIKDMKLNEETKQFFQEIIRQEVNRVFSENKEKFFQMIFCKPDNIIKKDKKAYDKLIKFCNKIPKNFPSKKEYMRWIEQVG